MPAHATLLGGDPPIARSIHRRVKELLLLEVATGIAPAALALRKVGFQFAQFYHQRGADQIKIISKHFPEAKSVSTAEGRGEFYVVDEMLRDRKAECVVVVDISGSDDTLVSFVGWLMTHFDNLGGCSNALVMRTDVVEPARRERWSDAIKSSPFQLEQEGFGPFSRDKYFWLRGDLRWPAGVKHTSLPGGVSLVRPPPDWAWRISIGDCLLSGWSPSSDATNLASCEEEIVELMPERRGLSDIRKRKPHAFEIERAMGFPVPNSTRIRPAF